MGIYRKKRDNDILKFIETYGGTNTNTIANLFFKDTLNAYILASKRLKILYNNKLLKRCRKSINSEYVYYINKPISEHKAKILETYSKISQLGKVIKFDMEVEIPNAKRRIDGLIELEIEDEEYISTYVFILEIDKTHNTSFKKIKDIYNSQHFQKQYDIFPSFVIVKRNEWDKKLKDKTINLVNLSWNLENINDIITE